jgi:hypothetical protein
VRQDQGEDISNEEEDGQEEGEITDNVGGILWDDLVKDEPRDGGSSLW